MSRQVLSAFAGPDIGIRRTFFAGVDSLVGFLKPRIGIREFAYKASYKAIL